MQFPIGVDGLRGIKQILHELTAQINIHFIKSTFTVYKAFKMFVNVLPLDVLSVCQIFEVGKEITFHPVLVKESMILIEDGFIALVTQDGCLLHHACVEVLFLLVGRLGKDVDAQCLACDNLHGGIVTIAGIVVQAE